MDETPVVELEELAPAAASPTPPAARWDTKIRSFRVRMIRFDRPESRTLTIRANNEAGARAQARSRSGRDWRIASIREA